MEQRNYYKLKNRLESMSKEGKRGQVAIFVIIALVIVAVILIVMFYPKLKTSFTNAPFTPESFLRGCIEPEVNKGVILLSKQGGYANPEGFLLYNDTKIKYLCYVTGYYKTCVVQEPMILNHFEQELNNMVSPKAKDCFAKLKQEYENRGFAVTGNINDAKTGIESGKVNVEFLAPITVSKETSQRFDKFNIQMKSELYDILTISQSIIEFESTYGDSETTTFIQYYPDLKIVKTKLSEGSKVYSVSNVITKEEFTFASRSLSWPPGYAV